MALTCGFSIGRNRVSLRNPVSDPLTILTAEEPVLARYTGTMSGGDVGWLAVADLGIAPILRCPIR
jgi:hypothetical protein